MATVAIIHAAEDALPARALAEKLRQAKLTVVLEKQPGEDLRGALKDAKVTVALWSPRSNAQQALIEDASFAKGKTKLIHACMQNAPAPDAFRSDKIVNLTGWRGEDDFPAWRELAKLVTDRAGVAAIPAPTPKPPSGFFQPGLVREAQPAGAAAQRTAQRQSAPPPRPQQAAQRPAPAPARATSPPPRAPAPAPQKSGGGGRMMMIAIITFIVVALVGGGGYYFWNQSQNADASATAWQAVDTNSADAIRAFLDGDPGDFRDDAQQALAQLEERTYEAASDADTIEAFEGFLNDFPDSEHALAARGRIAELQSLQPTTPTEANAPPATPGATPDPDLVPPGATATPPAPAATGGPAPITPPAPEPTPAEPPATTP
jgi:hypothetical protein